MSNSSLEGTLPSNARSASGARMSRARAQSRGRGRRPTVHARYRRQPPRAGSAMAFKGIETRLTTTAARTYLSL